MLKEICCDIKDNVALASGYVSKHYEFCEPIKFIVNDNGVNKEVVYPAFYVGGGNYEQIHNYDVNGVSYVRKNGAVTFGNPTSKGDNVRLTACNGGGSAFVQLTYPLRLVMIVPKTKLDDDAFSDDLLAQEIIGLINQDVTLAIDGVRSISYNVTGYEDDALQIWNKEIQGMQYQMNFKYTYIAVNFNAVLVANTDCFTRLCSSY